MPRMIDAFKPPTPRLLSKFPPTCPGREWEEPEYTKEEDGEGDCYDVVWQLTLTRPKGDVGAPWQTVSFAQLHMGYGGEPGSPCAEGFAPLAD